MIKVVKESDDNIFALCPFHSDTEASLVIRKTGKWAGQYFCFGCQAQGNAKDLGIQVETKSTKKKKIVNWSWFLQLSNPINPLEVFEKRDCLAEEWNVDPFWIWQLNHEWNEKAHLFPMYNEYKQIIGLQQRFPNGRKICMAGSKLGLFLSNKFPRSNVLLICEGVSDLAVALNLGFAAVGRPSCNTGARLIARWLQKYKWDKTVIVSDTGNDAEINGAIKLKNYLQRSWKVDIIKPEAKDLRAYRDLIGHEKTKQWLNEVTK